MTEFAGDNEAFELHTALDVALLTGTLSQGLPRAVGYNVLPPDTRARFPDFLQICRGASGQIGLHVSTQSHGFPPSEAAAMLDILGRNRSNAPVPSVRDLIFTAIDRLGRPVRYSSRPPAYQTSVTVIGSTLIQASCQWEGSSPATDLPAAEILSIANFVRNLD